MIAYTGLAEFKIQNEDHLGGNMDEGGHGRSKQTSSGRSDTHQIDRDRAGEILPNNSPRPGCCRSLSERRRRPRFP
jgi:hypothetical protein